MLYIGFVIEGLYIALVMGLLLRKRRTSGRVWRDALQASQSDVEALALGMVPGH